jgi:ketosteroid isomerase-like protein
MNEHPNAKRIRDLFDAFRSGDVTAIENAMAADAVWHFPGRAGRLAGSHRGREAIFAFLGRVMELTDGTFALELEDVVAGDERAVAVFRGHGTRAGKTLDNPTCLVVRLKDGKATEIHEFVWNLFEVDDFWS